MQHMFLCVIAVSKQNGGIEPMSIHDRNGTVHNGSLHFLTAFH